MSSASLTQARDPFAGHIGHLSVGQETALASLKTKLQSSGHYEPPRDDSPASHDDVTLVRFLRARKFDVEGAYTQFTATEAWRKKEKVAEQYDSFDLDEYTLGQSVYTQYTGRRAKDGSPLYVYRVSALTKEKVNEYSKKAERLEPRMIVLSETMTAFTLPMCSSLPRPDQAKPIDATICIVDVASVSLTRFWQLKGHMQRASVMATAHYPETLGAIYLVGAPNFFSTVWSWVNRWFDPGTVEKIFILSSNEVLPTLLKHIDIANIPNRYGGQLDWDFGDRPNLDDETKKALGVEEMPKGPVRWTREDGLRLTGTGRSEEELRKEEERRASRPNTASPRVDEASSQESASTSTPAPASAPAPAPAPATEAAPIVASNSVSGMEGSAPLAVPIAAIAASEAEVLAAEPNGAVHVQDPVMSDSEDDDNTMWETARENPGVPLKALAAALEGTTL